MSDCLNFVHFKYGDVQSVQCKTEAHMILPSMLIQPYVCTIVRTLNGLILARTNFRAPLAINYFRARIVCEK